MSAVRLRRSRRGVAAWLGAVVLMAGIGCSRSDVDPAASTTTETTTTAPAATTTEVPLAEGRQVASFVPSVGVCFDRREVNERVGQTTKIILVLDCSQPHGNEVFAVITTDEKDYPGEVALKNRAKLECPPKFETYVGMPYETSELELGYWLPSQTQWSQTYQKTIGCLITSADGSKLVGSAQGTRR